MFLLKKLQSRQFKKQILQLSTLCIFAIIKLFFFFCRLRKTRYSFPNHFLTTYQTIVIHHSTTPSWISLPTSLTICSTNCHPYFNRSKSRSDIQQKILNLAILHTSASLRQNYISRDTKTGTKNQPPLWRNHLDWE